jgi:hypothetical protein
MKWEVAFYLLSPLYLQYDPCIQLGGVKHGVTEMDVQWAMATAVFDEIIEGFDNKYLLIGFDVSGNLIEVMYNLVGEDIANIFHAMKCRNELLRKLSERGYYADFD